MISKIVVTTANKRMMILSMQKQTGNPYTELSIDPNDCGQTKKISLQLSPYELRELRNMIAMYESIIKEEILYEKLQNKE